MTYADAGKAALADAMRRDPRVWALGEDLGRGGVFGQYKGLQEEFGAERIVDAPISEAAIMGVAVGAALIGTRPVAEMRFADFALCAVDELVNQAAKARFMFGGQARVPLVVRQPVGMWRSSAAQHSQSLEAWYAHVPGLVVVRPATPEDNLALLGAAIACDDPVVYMEHKDLWGLTGEVDETARARIGEARLARAGTDVTVVSWSGMVHTALRAAELASAQGVEAEVIDLRTLWPWDRAAVAASVQKTGRLLVVHEAVQVGDFGAEIAAHVAEHQFEDLRAPVRRLGAPLSCRRSSSLPETVGDRHERDVLTGGGVHLSGAAAALQAFAEATATPVAHTLSGKGAIACTHDLSAGIFGRYSRIANALIEAADVILVVGCKLGEIATKRYTVPPPGKALIHLEIDPEEIGRCYPAIVGLWGDARAGIEDLHTALEEDAASLRSARRDWAGEVRTVWRAGARRRKPSSPPTRSRGEVQKALPDDGLLIADGGFAAHWGGLLFNTQKPGRSFVPDRGFASIGYGLPEAIGAKLAAPGRAVAALTGTAAST